MLECKILCIPHSEGPLGLIYCEPLVNLFCPWWKGLVEKSVQVWVYGRWKVAEKKKKLKAHLLFQSPFIPISLISFSPFLLLGKQHFMVRVWEMGQRHPDQCPDPGDPTDLPVPWRGHCLLHKCHAFWKFNKNHTHSSLEWNLLQAEVKI